MSSAGQDVESNERSGNGEVVRTSPRQPPAGRPPIRLQQRLSSSRQLQSDNVNEADDIESQRASQAKEEKKSPRGEKDSVVSSDYKGTDTGLSALAQSKTTGDDSPTDDKNSFQPHQDPGPNGLELTPRSRQENVSRLDTPSRSFAQPSTVTEQTVAKPTGPIRTEPLKTVDTRRRRLDRLAENTVPEIHVVGELKSGLHLAHDLSEGVFCRFKVELGSSCELLGGELTGQTQIGYCRHHLDEQVPFAHPIDVHFGMIGLQGWGSPRIVVQSFRFDWCGRKILNGYGFAHFPLQPGKHSIEIPLWRPLGTPDQELRAMLLQETPALLSEDPLYTSAWKDRCRLLTTACGSVTLDIFVITRYLREQGVQQRPAV